MSRATTDPVAGISEQLRRCEPTYPCTNNDHVCWVSCRLQPIFNNVQQLFVVFVVETILREAREPLGAQETCQQEDWEEDWGEKRREEKALGNEHAGSFLTARSVAAQIASKYIGVQAPKRNSIGLIQINWHGYSLWHQQVSQDAGCQAVSGNVILKEKSSPWMISFLSHSRSAFMSSPNEFEPL